MGSPADTGQRSYSAVSERLELFSRPRCVAGPVPAGPVNRLGAAEHRAIVANNLRDYRPLHHEAVVPGGTGHYGMIFMPSGYRRTKVDTGRIVVALEAILAQYPGEEDLANGEAWL